MVLCFGSYAHKHILFFIVGNRAQPGIYEDRPTPHLVIWTVFTTRSDFLTTRSDLLTATSDLLTRPPPFSDLSFPELLVFRFVLFNIVTFQAFRFQNCTFPDYSFSELSLFRLFLSRSAPFFLIFSFSELQILITFLSSIVLFRLVLFIITPFGSRLRAQARCVSR